MHRLTWVLQIVLGVYFVAVGVMHLALPPGLPELMAWMHDLSPTVHWVSGLAEIAGGFGLLLPSLTRIRPMLTPLAGAGLILVMISAAIWHASRGEVQNSVTNLVVVALLAVVVHVRWRTRPIEPR